LATPNPAGFNQDNDRYRHGEPTSFCSSQVKILAVAAGAAKYNRLPSFIKPIITALAASWPSSVPSGNLKDKNAIKSEVNI